MTKYKERNHLYFLILFVTIILLACNHSNETTESSQPNEGPFLVVLGTIQDGGSPHIGCIKECCKNLTNEQKENRMVVSLGIIDPLHHNYYMIEASPDFTAQLSLAKQYCKDCKPKPAGIFLTHAHIGHYSGLMFLGREALGAKQFPVYCMPRMNDFLESNGPWSQLVKLNNIKLEGLQDDSTVQLSSTLSITPFIVPHRDEYSETVGFRITGPHKTVVFIPDIDKWSKWSQDLHSIVKETDALFIDGTFYDIEELPNRDMAKIPHPFVTETMKLLSNLNPIDKSKINFIHFNHSNPLLDSTSNASQDVLIKGFKIAQLGQITKL